MSIGAPDGSDAGKPFSRQFRLAMYLSTSLNALNTSLIATAMVPIASSFEVGPAEVTILVSVFYVTAAVAQPAAGQISTVKGARTVLLWGLVVTGIGGLLGGLAGSLIVLVVARVVLAIGTSAAYPAALAMVHHQSEHAGSEITSRVLGGIAVCAQLSATLGLFVGGVLVGVAGWRAVFLINFPLSMLVLVLAYLYLPRSRPSSPRPPLRLTAALDIPGTLVLVACMVLLIRAMSRGGVDLVGHLGALVLLVGVLFVVERHSANPLIDVRLLSAHGALARTYVRNCLMCTGLYAVMYGVSQWLDHDRGLTPGEVGAVLLPMTAVAAVFGTLASRRVNLRVMLVTAGASLALGGVALQSVDSETPIVLILVAIGLFGLSAGVGTVTNQAALYLQAAPEHLPVAAGLLRTSVAVGAVLSTGVLGSAFGHGTSDSGLHSLAWCLALIGVILVTMSLFDRGIPSSSGRYIPPSPAL